MSIGDVFDINTGKRINAATGRPYPRQDAKEVAANLALVKRMKESAQEEAERSAEILRRLRERLGVGPKVTA